ncbi:hypothetical protein V1478_010530 [Vespula squamosa]|uniref:Uncharacterized protein n=1 Tax=Vespula squamosa TaxID=30214 RepID=A0ABD2AI13_VESSQ
MANTIISSMSVGNSTPRCMKVTQHLGYGGPVINDLKINSTTMRPITLAGTIGIGHIKYDVEKLHWKHSPKFEKNYIKTRNNELLFLMPKSTLIIRFCTERGCGISLSVLYRIEDSWIQFLLKPMETLILAPLASNEIYTEKEIEELKEHIMFSIERPTELNDLAKSYSRQIVTSETTSIYNLIDEKASRKIVQSTIDHKPSNVLTIVSITSKCRASNKSDILTTKKPHLDHPKLTRNLCIIPAIQSKTGQQKRTIYSKSLSELWKCFLYKLLHLNT